VEYLAIKSLQALFLGAPMKEDKGLMTFMQGFGAKLESPFLSYLVRADEGNILIDTGLHPDDVAMLSGGQIKGLPEEQHLPNRLKEVGLTLDDINMVILTHMHLDHVGWLSYLKKAEVVVQKEEYNFTMDSPAWTPYRYTPQRFDLKHLKFKLVDGDNVLMPGITLIFTPGHSIGHQSVMVDLPQTGPIIISGDAVFIQENLDKEFIPTTWSDTRQTLLSIKKLKVWAQVRKARIFPGHDMEYYRNNIKKLPEAYT
jgi:glyoxylase-like metal-dependent hydrolase (beta-lactamase superfamily II)